MPSFVTRARPYVADSFIVRDTFFMRSCCARRVRVHNARIYPDHCPPYILCYYQRVEYTAARKPLMHRRAYRTLRYASTWHVALCAREGRCSAWPFPAGGGRMKKSHQKYKNKGCAHVARPIAGRCGMRETATMGETAATETMDRISPSVPRAFRRRTTARFCSARRRPAGPAASILLYRLILFVGTHYVFLFVFIVVVRSPEIPQTTRLLFLWYNIPRKTLTRARTIDSLPMRVKHCRRYMIKLCIGTALLIPRLVFYFIL